MPDIIQFFGYGVAMGFGCGLMVWLVSLGVVSLIHTFRIGAE